MSGDPKPVPRPTPETRPYWEATRHRELVHHRCDGCGAGSQHPRAICACGSTDLTWTSCTGRGRLFSYVVVHRPEQAFADEAPFVLAIVELEEGVRMTTRIVDVPADPAALPLDMDVELRWLRRGDANLPVFAPAGPEGA